MSDTARLQAYLQRIGYAGSLEPNLVTLVALHREHLNAVPFENLDVQFGAPPDLNLDTIFDKLVMRGRGGWCYEMNGVFGWVLKEIGFEVTRIAGGVMRQSRGDEQSGTHLCLIVTLDRDYLVDVGFGGALVTPIPLQVGEHNRPPFKVALSDAGNGYWRYSERAEGEPFSFDFRAEPADEKLLDTKCAWQGSDPSSNFTNNLVVQKRFGSQHVVLRGRILKATGAASGGATLINSAEELVSTLKNVFGLDVPESVTLWPKVSNRHARLFDGEV